MMTTAMVAVVLILPLVLATCAHAKLTDDAEHINNYGSCPLKKYKENKYGPKPWIFDLPPCGYLSTGPCTDLERDYMQMSCDEPFPDANFYHKDETVIATYFDDSSFRQNREWEDVRKSSPCPLNLTYQWSKSDYEKVTESFDCPLTCYDCANLCRVQAMSVAKERQKFDPTMQGCNAWVFCTNPNGCANGEKTMPGLSCTLKRIPLDNPDIQEQMRSPSNWDGPPAGLVAEGSGDFVSGFCNVRETCVNSDRVKESCGLRCGNENKYDCKDNTCTSGCIPSCPC